MRNVRVRFHQIKKRFRLGCVSLANKAYQKTERIAIEKLVELNNLRKTGDRGR